MRGGRLKTRVQLQRYTETQTDTGFPTKTWATYATVWAGIEMAKGNETEVIAEELVSQKQVMIPIRYSSEVAGVNEKDRVKYGTRIFSILYAVLPVDRSTPSNHIELHCLEGKKDSG